MMRYCTKCVTPHTRPHLEFDENGVCSACQMAEQKLDTIDWEARKQEFESLIERHKNNTPGQYDCIVPVSGGKDSIYQVHVLKNVYHMNTLAVTFRTLARTPTGEANIQSLRNMGVDHIDFSPNPVGVNKLTKKAFEEFGDCSLLDHLAIYGIVTNLAVKLRIPFIIWGENPYMEYGGEEDDSQKAQLHRNFLETHNILKNRSVEDWVGEDLSLYELQSMIYPSDEALKEVGCQAIFLGYYLPWDAKQNVEISKKYGFQIRPEGPIMGLYDYADLDCMNIVIHHYFKWLKFGFNRITDHSSNEIRKGRMTREEGIELVGKYDGYKPPKEYIEAFCKQIGISWEYFWEVAEKFRNQDVWKKDENGQWYIEGWIAGDKQPDQFPHTPLNERVVHWMHQESEKALT